MAKIRMAERTAIDLFVEVEDGEDFVGSLQSSDDGKLRYSPAPHIELGAPALFSLAKMMGAIQEKLDLQEHDSEENDDQN